ncbi:MAG: 3-deoxy-D-manno-octulosonic acid transferase [Pseudorhodoplanes sp.]
MTMATPLAPLWLARRLKQGKEDPERLSERYGESALARPEGPLLWLHGASIGEILGAAPLISHIRAQNFNVLVTSGTVTSARVARSRMPPGVLHQFIPIDAPRFVKRFLDHWQPDLGMFIESDLWPNMVFAAAARRIPLVVINGRMSERSFNRWSALSGTIGGILRQFDLCLTQSVLDANRYSELGAPRISTTGNLKLDVPPPPIDSLKLDALRLKIGERPVFAAASTHPGEDEIVIDMHRNLRQLFPRLLTIIAPRHPERGADIAAVARRAGLSADLRTQSALPKRSTEIFVADTLGELGLLYKLAPVVFIGGSLVPHGGQNPIEAVKHGAVVLHGPHVWNFAEVYRALDEARGADIVDGRDALITRAGLLMKDATSRETMRARAETTVEKLGGALHRTLTELEPYLIQLRTAMKDADA